MKKLLLISLVWLAILETNAQSTPSEGTAPTIVWHVPRTNLAPGDTLFYKLYFVSPVSYALDPIVKTVRVQLIDTKLKRSLSTQYLRVNRGLAYGSIPLPDSRSTTHYSLVASTLQSNKLFSQAITVGEKPGTMVSLSNASFRQPASRLTVHAEGGNLVQGIQTKLLMLTTDELGQPTSGQGRIQDQLGETITTFSTDSSGQGVWYITPQPGNRYEVILPNNNMRTPLPAVLPGGYAFSADYSTSADSIYLYVDKSADLLPDTVKITGMLRGKQWYQARIPMTQATAFVGLSKSSVPATGLLTFRLMDSNNNLLGQRLLFHQVRSSIQVTLTPDKPSYAPGEKITLSFLVTDSLHRPSLAHLSLAVTEQPTLGDSTEANKAKDLIDFIKNPDWLLIHSSETYSPSQLQLINEWLIGYQPRSLTASQPTTKPNRRQSKNGLVPIRGIVRTPFGKGAANATVTLLGQSLPKSLHRTKTDSTGHFEFEGLDFEGSVTVVLSSKDANQIALTDIELLADEPTLPTSVDGEANSVNGLYVGDTTTKVPMIPYGQSDTKAKDLEVVVVKAKKASLLAGDSRSQLYSEPDIEILFDEKSYGFTSIRESIAGRVPGMTISESAFTIRGFDSHAHMMIMLDGVPSDYQAIMSIPPFSVRAVDVIKDPGKMGIFGVRGGSGVINVLTKRGEFVKNSGPKEVVTRTIRGYEPVSEGHVVYNKGLLTYWNPSVDIQPRKEQTVTFFAPSHPTVCIVTAIVTNGLGSFVEQKINIYIKP